MDIEQERDALLPCPFCGGRAKEYDRFNANVVTCRDCGAKVRQSEMGQGDAAERWNRRFAMQSQGPAEQALAELVDKIIPGLDTGDLLADAQQASAALQLQDREDVVQKAIDKLSEMTPRMPKAITYDQGWRIIDVVQRHLCEAIDHARRHIEDGS